MALTWPSTFTSGARPYLSSHIPLKHEKQTWNKLHWVSHHQNNTDSLSEVRQLQYFMFKLYSICIISLTLYHFPWLLHSFEMPFVSMHSIMKSLINLTKLKLGDFSTLFVLWWLNNFKNFINNRFPLISYSAQNNTYRKERWVCKKLVLMISVCSKSE